MKTTKIVWSEGRKAELGERICAALSAAYPNDLDINQICDALGFAPGALGDQRKRLGKSMALEMINHLWNEKMIDHPTNWLWCWLPPDVSRPPLENSSLDGSAQTAGSAEGGDR